MSKPLFRYTVGSCLPQGLEVLGESIKQTTQVLGVDRFDWMICYNGLNEEQLQTIKDHIGDLPFTLYEQNWELAAISSETKEWSTPKRKDGSFEWNGNHCGGTMWKVCPPRMRMETHEIVMDNDIVIRKPIPQIEYFLKTNNMALILEEPIRFYGRFDGLFPDKGPFLNSGLMGFPPGYNYQQEIIRVWEENGSMEKLSQADEQGLLMYTLNQVPNIRISKEQVKEILARDFNATLEETFCAYHFTQSNRIPKHHAWKKYKEQFHVK